MLKRWLAAMPVLVLVLGITPQAAPADFGYGAEIAHSFIGEAETGPSLSGTIRLGAWLLESSFTMPEGPENVGAFGLGYAHTLAGPLELYGSVSRANRFAESGPAEGGVAVDLGILVPTGYQIITGETTTWLRTGLRWIAWDDRVHTLGYRAGFVAGWSR